MNQNKRTKFCVFYDGESYVNHEMDIMTIGRSITSLGKVLIEANKIINGDDSEVSVLMDAEPIKGSFGLEFVLQNISDCKDILSPLGLFEYGSIGMSAIALIKALKGDEVVIVEDENTKEDYTKISVNGEDVECESKVVQMLRNPTIRNNLEILINKPLREKGTSSFIVKRDRDSAESELVINKEESKSFVKLNLIEEEAQVDEYGCIVKFITASVKKKDGWKVERNGKEITASMLDELFLERLRNMTEPHVFGKKFNVVLKEVSVVQFGSKSKTKFFITRVNGGLD